MPVLAAGPPADARSQARSDFGTATTGEACAGCRPTSALEGEPGGADLRWAAYEIILDCGSLVVVLRDDGRSVRAVAGGEGRKRRLRGIWGAAPRALKLVRTEEPPQPAASSLDTARIARDLDRAVDGTADYVESRPEEWHASVLRAEVQDDVWSMLKLASTSSGSSSLDLQEVMPILQAMQPGITEAQIEAKFAETVDTARIACDWDRAVCGMADCVESRPHAGDRMCLRSSTRTRTASSRG